MRSEVYLIKLSCDIKFVCDLQKVAPFLQVLMLSTRQCKPFSNMDVNEHERLTNFTLRHKLKGIRVMVFIATFNNMSVILWRSVLFVWETSVKTTDLPHVTDKLYHITLSGIRTHNVSGDMH